LLVVGVVGIATWAASNTVMTVWQDWENWSFDRQVAGKTATLSGYLEAKRARLENRDTEPEPAKPIPIEPPVERPTIAPNGLIGRIEIPRLGLRAIVREGVGQDTLGLAVGHIPGTAFPGQDGNVAVAGHRDTLFRGLRSIRENDLIRFETADGLYLYEVASMEIVKPENVSVLRPGKEPELTLVTCYPFNFIGSAPDRYIVKARQLPLSALTVQANDPPVRTVARTKVEDDGVNFSVAKNHSRQLAPGISMGLTDTNVEDRRINGWMWLLADRKTIWLRNQSTHDPVIFYSDGKRRELRFTNVSRSAVSGYLE